MTGRPTPPPMPAPLPAGRSTTSAARSAIVPRSPASCCDAPRRSRATAPTAFHTKHTEPGTLKMAKIHVTTTINGAPTEFLCEPSQTLLDVLRDNLGLTGSKEGCGSGGWGGGEVTLEGGGVWRR